MPWQPPCSQRSRCAWRSAHLHFHAFLPFFCFFFFFNDTATTEIYTLSLHDALPICLALRYARQVADKRRFADVLYGVAKRMSPGEIADARQRAKEWIGAFERKKALGE